MPNNVPRFNRSPRLGEQLVLKGILTEEALENALSAAKATNMKLGEYLTSHGIVPEEDILKALSEQLNFPLYNPDEFPPSEGLGAAGRGARKPPRAPHP